MGAITETSEIPLDVKLPKDVELADASRKLSVSVSVQGISKLDFTFEASEISVEGLPSWLSGHVNTDSVLVTVIASEPFAETISKGDILLYVDAAEITKPSDSIEMDLLYKLEKEVKSVVFEPAKVRVTIIG
jgi:hypothetical protein